MMTGTVTAFDASRGVGWIVGADDVTYFLPTVEIQNPPLGPGDPVEFNPERVLATGPRATAVRRMPPAFLFGERNIKTLSAERLCRVR